MSKTIISISDLNLKSAVALARAEYAREAAATPALPSPDEAGEGLACVVEELISEAKGCALLEDGVLTGYVGFFGPWKGFHGLCKGVFSPLGGSAFGGSDPARAASETVAAAMELLEKEGVTGFALSRPVHAEEANRSLLLNGFGVRCSDAIARIGDLRFPEPACECEIRELTKEERPLALGLYNALVDHLLKPPCCFPTPLEKPEEWAYEEENRVFAAFVNGEIAGFTSLDEDSETFLTERSDMANLGSTFVKEEYRGTGLALRLVSAATEAAKAGGARYLGVDYETLNPTALRFWTKRFAPYTYSYHRRIDERVLYRMEENE